jgi:hypothetical protein
MLQLDMIVRVACRRHYRKGRKEHKGKRVKREFLVLLRLFLQNWDAPFCKGLAVLDFCKGLAVLNPY